MDNYIVVNSQGLLVVCPIIDGIILTDLPLGRFVEMPEYVSTKLHFKYTAKERAKAFINALNRLDAGFLAREMGK